MKVDNFLWKMTVLEHTQQKGSLGWRKKNIFLKNHTSSVGFVILDILLDNPDQF